MKSVFLISSSLLVFLSLAIPAKAESRHSVIISGQIEENITFIQTDGQLKITSNLLSGTSLVKNAKAIIICANI